MISERFGALDIGSNSVRTLVVEQQGRVLHYVTSSSSITRLTEGWGEGRGVLQSEPLSRTVEAVALARHSLDLFGVTGERRRGFATESLRGACNATTALTILEKAAGFPIRILEGEAEGVYGFRGARMALSEAQGVFDLGGGSLEICTENQSISLPLGAVRMTEQFREDEDALGAFVRALLMPVLPEKAIPLVGVGGTSSTTAFILDGRGIEDYAPSMVHGRTVALQDLQTLRRRLGSLSLEDRRRVRGMPPPRADILVSGMMVIETLLGAVGCCSYVHSECDLLWGVLAEAAGISDGKAMFS